MLQRGRRAVARRWAPLRPIAHCCVAVALYWVAAPVELAEAGLSGLQRIASGAGGITSMAFAPGDAEHLFVVAKDGLVRVLDTSTGQFQERAFLNVLSQADAAGDGGLLALAFHPDYQTNGKFYVTLTVDNGGIPIGTPPDPVIRSPFTAQVREYTVSSNPLLANENYSTVIEWVKPQADHTGGWLGFSPINGYLYVATGDGGGGNDNGAGHTPGLGNAQDLTNNLLGKLLRLDVNGDDFPKDEQRNYTAPADNPYVNRTGDDEIFAYGLRSPWKASFDRATGDLWLGDVGEDSREEVDFIGAHSVGGQNFGWRRREGADPTPEVGGTPPPGNVHPVYDYMHTQLDGDPAFEGNSVTGGYAYRGPDPELQGQYIFADFISDQFWMFDPEDPYGTVTNVTDLLQPTSGAVNLITTFAEGPKGNLYVGTLSGDVFRIGTDAVQPGDFQRDARVDTDDLDVWRENFGAHGEEGWYAGDGDGDGDVDGADFLMWQRQLGYNAQVLATPGGASVQAPEPRGALLMIAAGMAMGSLAIRRPNCRRRGA
jgi:glucose/arabinose dehydrogenase